MNPHFPYIHFFSSINAFIQSFRDSQRNKSFLLLQSALNSSLMAIIDHHHLGFNTNTLSSSSTVSFSDFPEDVQLSILSFLTPTEVTSFSYTSKRFFSLCKCDSKLWVSMCERKWGSMTQIKKWGNGKIEFKLLYKTLDRWENLIGFWRRSGHGTVGIASTSPPPLVFFEWGPSFITGSRVSPSKSGTYKIIKTPFLWMGISPRGEPLNYLDPDGRFQSPSEFIKAAELGVSDSDLVSVNVSFMGKNHVIVEENHCFGSSYSPEGRISGSGSRGSPSYSDLRGDDLWVLVEEVIGVEGTSPGSLPETLEIYQYFANRTSPGADRASRRRQRKKDKERNGKQKWEAQHFVKIVNCAPTPARPLQGLWKGICDDMSLEFYLVAYDDIGGIACRRVGDALEPFTGYSPVFWTSSTTFIESPLSTDEEYLYDSRIHLQPPSVCHFRGHSPFIEDEEVLRILNINSSYDLVIPDLTAPVNPRHMEGRIWHYASGTFGFGFLRNNFIIDLKHIALNGHLLDTVEKSN